MQSIHHAARRLASAPAVSVAAILTLALGLAVATSVFTIVNAVLIRPLPYGSPEELVSLSHTLVVGGDLRVEQSDASLLFYERHHRAFSHFGGYQATGAGVGPAGGTDAERVPAARVTAGLFPALGAPPIEGRLFDESDDRPGAAPVVVIAEGLWRRRYGGERTLFDRPLEIDGVPHEVIGILPARFRFPSADTELWLPLRLDPAKTDSATFDYRALARLRKGVSIEEATADAQALLERLPDEFPGRLTREAIEQTRMRASVRPLAEVVVGDVGRSLFVVLAAAAFVLATACANVANLFLVRAEGRRTALALKRALGARPSDVLNEFLAEGLVVSGLAGILGVLSARAVVAALRGLGSDLGIPRIEEAGLDGSVVAVSVLLMAVSALFVSALALVRARTWSFPDVSMTGRTVASSRSRQGLIAVQVASALVLLAGSGLLARSLWRLSSVRPGFDPSNAISFRLALPLVSYPTSDDSVRFFLRAADAVASVPGVESAGAVSKLPLEEEGRTDSAVFIEDRPLAPGALPGIHSLLYATPSYFEAAGIPFIEGRSFSRPDPPRVVLEAVVSRLLAERYWPDESPIGKRLRIFSKGPWLTVVGVVGDVRDRGLDQPEDTVLYCPLLPAREDPRWAPRDVAFVARTSAGAFARDGLADAIRDAVRRLDSSLPLYRIRDLSDIVEQASARRRFTLILVGATSVVALFLGAVGLYGVLSYIVTLRTREMGIRLAIGAPPSHVRRMVLRQGLAVTALGVAAGLLAAIFLTRFLGALLFEVSPMDPVVLALASALLFLVAALASWLPARRAAIVDVARTLRAD
jgi:predicted permease